MTRRKASTPAATRVYLVLDVVAGRTDSHYAVHGRTLCGHDHASTAVPIPDGEGRATCSACIRVVRYARRTA